MRQMSSGVLGDSRALQDIVLGEMDCVQFTRVTFVLLQAFLTRALGKKMPARDGQCISLEFASQHVSVAVLPASRTWPLLGAVELR